MRPVSRPHDTGSDTNSPGPSLDRHHAGLIWRLILLFALSMRGRIDTSAHGTWTDHLCPRHFQRLSKKVRRAVAAMSRANARVR